MNQGNSPTIWWLGTPFSPWNLPILLWVSRFSALPCWYQNGLPSTKNSVQNLVSSLYTLVEKGIPPLWIVISGNPKKISMYYYEWPELVDQGFVHQNFGHEKTPSASFVALLLPQRTQWSGSTSSTAVTTGRDLMCSFFGPKHTDLTNIWVSSTQCDLL